MFSKRQNSPARVALFSAIGILATVVTSGAAVRAQTAPVGPSGAQVTPTDPNCAVSTARIASVDVTQFFGVRGGASGFTQNFGLPSDQPDQTLAQRCIRLEIDNPAPGDLVLVGGYVLGGFAFDPLTRSEQGSGISSVRIFLDDPNQGGAVVGDVSTDGAGTTGKAFGLPSARGAAFGEQFTNSGFRLTVQIPSSAAGSQHALFVLAVSSAGRVGTVAVPVIVGNLTPALPTRTP
jgi:hypothetical protein